MSAMQQGRCLRPPGFAGGGVEVSASSAQELPSPRRIQIAYITDRTMFWPTVVSLMSALEGTREPLTVHFFGHKLNQADVDFLKSAVRHWPETQVLLHEVTEEMLIGAKDYRYYSPAHIVLVRIPGLLSGKVLCLDGDTIVHGDIAELFDLDLDGHPVAAVRDFGGLWERFNQLPEHESRDALERKLMSPRHISELFNSGVVLFDLDTMHSIPGMADSLVNTMGLSGDQNVLNFHLKGHVHLLDPSWNVMPGTFHLVHKLQVAMTGGDRTIGATAPRIVHFAGVVKPWHYFAVERLCINVEEMRHELLLGFDMEDKLYPWNFFPLLQSEQMVLEYVSAVRSYRNTAARVLGMV